MSFARQRPVLPGLFLVLLGLWLLLRELGIPGSHAVWPLFVILVGLGVWGHYILNETERKPDNVFWGTALLLVGFFFLLRENGWYGPATWDWGIVWPVFPAIMGTSAGVQWLLYLHRWDALLWSLIGWVVALVGFAYTSEFISGETALQLARLWPLFLILGGMGLVLQYVLENRRNPS